MVKQLLIVAGLAASLSSVAGVRFAPTGKVNSPELVSMGESVKFPVIEAKMNDGSSPSVPQKATQIRPQWKRPAGQFWGTGYCVEQKILGYIFTPLVIRPFTDFTFENVSNISSTPTWDVEYVDVTGAEPQYVQATFTDKDLTWGYIEFEAPTCPLLSYPGFLSYPSQYEGRELTDFKYLPLLSAKQISDFWELGNQPVCSHYYSLFSRNQTQTGAGLGAYTGAKAYDGDENGYWFGTNASGINAMATRFEKPDQPYLLNGVYWYYQYGQDITKEVPLKAYVYKTLNDNADYNMNDTEGNPVIRKGVELGELIAVSDAVIPLQHYDKNGVNQDAVCFQFVERNPVTGAETAVSLEIEDDITIVVVGFNEKLENGGFVTTGMSLDDYDEGYGNLGFLGTFEQAEDGGVNYSLRAISNFFVDPTPNTTLGVLADVSYPWLTTYYTDQPDDIQLGNQASTSTDVIGLQYVIQFLSSSMTEEWDVTYNGEDECDWLRIADYYDEMESVPSEDGEVEDYYTGLSMLLFEADPNPENVDRTCKVKISIPAASYTVTFRQGTNNAPDAVEIIGVDSDAQYFDLQGRQVTNPEKGVYIKKSGNQAQKVIL